MTHRLYHDDAHLRSFEALVIESRDGPSGPQCALDRTAFYPGGGGQPSDRGILGGASVLDVREDGATLWHVTDRAVPTGTRVVGSLDWERRFDHMQQHTGQHVLSRAFEEIADAATLSFHLGEALVTIDVDHPDPDDATLERVEGRANGIVFENRPVFVRLVEPDELASVPLRKPPAVSGTVRVVEVEGYDWSGCGGTHVARTGEIGLVTILGVERYKGGTRVAFACGARAMRRAREARNVLARACRDLTTGEADLPNAIARLKEERGELKRRLRPLLRESLERESERLLDEAPRGPHGPVVVRHWPERTAEEIGLLARGIAARGGIALLATGKENPRAHFAAPAGTIPVGSLLTELCRQFGGSGGGRPEAAQGALPAESVSRALEAARGRALLEPDEERHP